jgi:hypothetical protein
MQLMRIIGVTVSLGFAFLILAVSLTSVSQVQSAQAGIVENQRELYFSSTVLPDHVAYPVKMALDRVKLESVSPIEQVYLKTEYANARFQAAQALLDKDKPALAVTTMTKAQKYLLSAAQQALETDMPDSVKTHVAKTIEYHVEQMQLISKLLTDEQRAVVDKLNQESAVSVQQLLSKPQR